MSDMPGEQSETYEEWTPEELRGYYRNSPDLADLGVVRAPSDDTDYLYEEELGGRRYRRGIGVAWYYDHGRYYAYILVNCPQRTLDVIDRYLQYHCMIVCPHYGRSHRPASNRVQYQWFMKVLSGDGRGVRKPSPEQIRAFFEEHFPQAVETGRAEQLERRSLERAASDLARRNEELAHTLREALAGREVHARRARELSDHIAQLHQELTRASALGSETRRRLLEANQAHRDEVRRLGEERQRRLGGNVGEVQIR
ncbi:MAG: hypothetical protein AB1505_23990 [Candidatus Latescibacterota bacterium]